MGKVFVLGWRRSAEGAALKISEAEWQKPSSSSDNDSDPHPGRPPELDLKSDWKRYLNHLRSNTEGRSLASAASRRRRGCSLTVLRCVPPLAPRH
jgi:hypothetical protein